jgi:hypothetical protein
MRLDQENHYPDDAHKARVSDLDLIFVSPYRPAACEVPQTEVGHTSEPDHIAKTHPKKMLALPGASTHVRCPPPNSPFGGALVSTIDSGHLGALYVGEAEEAAVV